MDSKPFILSKDDRIAQKNVYDRLQKMMELKEQIFPHFSGINGPRSFNQYIDDSERILNGYTLSRSQQGKEDWQSNMLDNITRAKLRAVVAGVGLKVPDTAFTSVNKKGLRSKARADI